MLAKDNAAGARTSGGNQFCQKKMLRYKNMKNKFGEAYMAPENSEINT